MIHFFILALVEGLGLAPRPRLAIAPVFNEAKNQQPKG
jgi:hypothetical protein